MHPVYNEIVNASIYGDISSIKNIHHSLIVEKMRLDKFFTLFLDKFSHKMDPKKPDTNLWNLYRSKMKEYSDLDQVIKASQYYINKSHV